MPFLKIASLSSAVVHFIHWYELAEQSGHDISFIIDSP
jgi:hypothetical protein